MHSVRLEPRKLILIGTRTTYQAIGDGCGVSIVEVGGSLVRSLLSAIWPSDLLYYHIPKICCLELLPHGTCCDFAMCTVKGLLINLRHFFCPSPILI